MTRIGILEGFGDIHASLNPYAKSSEGYTPFKPVSFAPEVKTTFQPVNLVRAPMPEIRSSFEAPKVSPMIPAIMPEVRPYLKPGTALTPSLLPSLSPSSMYCRLNPNAPGCRLQPGGSGPTAPVSKNPAWYDMNSKSAAFINPIMPEIPSLGPSLPRTNLSPVTLTPSNTVSTSVEEATKPKAAPWLPIAAAVAAYFFLEAK